MFPITWNEIAPYLYTECKISRKRTDVICRFKQIAKYFKDKEFNRVNTMVLFDEMLQKKRRHATLNNLLTIMKHCSAYLVYAGKADKDFLTTFSYFEQQSSHFDILTEDEFRRLVEVEIPRSRDSEYINFKYSLIIEILGIYGFRISELANLKWGETYTGTEFIVIDGKTQSSNRKLEVLAYLREKIDRLRHYDHNYVFGGAKGKLLDTTMNEELELRLKACGISKRIRAHSFRRTAITNYIEKDVNQFKLIKLTGHKDFSSLNRYNHLAYKAATEIIESNAVVTKHWTIDTLKKRNKKYYDQIRDTPFQKICVNGSSFSTILCLDQNGKVPDYVLEFLQKVKNDSSIELVDESTHNAHNL